MKTSHDFLCGNKIIASYYMLYDIIIFYIYVFVLIYKCINYGDKAKENSNLVTCKMKKAPLLSPLKFKKNNLNIFQIFLFGMIMLT